jgi:hypothetical protein
LPLQVKVKRNIVLSHIFFLGLYARCLFYFTAGNVYVTLGVLILAVVFSIMLVNWMRLVYEKITSEQMVLGVLLIFIIIGFLSICILYRKSKYEHCTRQNYFISIKLVFLFVFGYCFIGHCTLYFLKHVTSRNCPEQGVGIAYSGCAILYTLMLFIFFLFHHHRHGQNTFCENLCSVGVLLVNVCIWLDTLFSESGDMFHYPDEVTNISTNVTLDKNCSYNATITSTIDDTEAFLSPAVIEFSLLAI